MATSITWVFAAVARTVPPCSERERWLNTATVITASTKAAAAANFTNLKFTRTMFPAPALERPGIAAIFSESFSKGSLLRIAALSSRNIFTRLAKISSAASISRISRISSAGKSPVKYFSSFQSGIITSPPGF